MSATRQQFARSGTFPLQPPGASPGGRRFKSCPRYSKGPGNGATACGLSLLVIVSLSETGLGGRRCGLSLTVIVSLTGIETGGSSCGVSVTAIGSVMSMRAGGCLSTTTVSEAVSLLGLPSLGVVMCAVLVRWWPARLAASATGRVMSGARSPGESGSREMQVMVAFLWLQLQKVDAGAMRESVSPTGRVSVSVMVPVVGPSPTLVVM